MLPNTFGKPEVDQIVNLTVFARCVSCIFECPNPKNGANTKTVLKNKSRALQLHFGTSPSIILPMVLENGTLEVEDHDLVLAQ